MKKFLLLVLVVFVILLFTESINKNEVPAKIVKENEIHKVEKIPKIQFGNVKNKKEFIDFIVYF